jgi:DtxR family transcriptional regulator, Mn-dependent transcriptional regulator
VAKQLSEAIQDYLREIYKLESAGARATTTAVAAKMNVAPPSATSMLKKLARLGFVEHTRYRGASLTPAGTRIALEVVRHHRLLEQYLAQALGLSLDAVHDEADRLEHGLSEELEARIDELLGFPTHDPHGDPIPSAELELERQELIQLAAVAEGEVRTIRRVPDTDGDLLHYLCRLSLVPGARIEVKAVAPFGGPITVSADGAEHAISRELAAQIEVG